MSSSFGIKEFFKSDIKIKNLNKITVLILKNKVKKEID